jgi:hypothetical protein
MSCSNCFNGCAEIVSDQCVRYTGIDVPVLGIKNGDSLSFVEQALITFLTSTLDGSGIKVDINPTIICNLVKQYLPTCGDLTVVDFLTALVKAACDLQTQVTAATASISSINSTLTVLNGPYTIGSCLTGVTPTSGTHAVLQATINALCAFVAEVEASYVLINDLDTLIADYIASLPSSTLVNQKMVPYVAYEYYGSLTNFDATGAGTGDWIKIYLCNGLNGTPDRRGVVAVGAISLVPGGPLPSSVSPAASPFNPNYALGSPIVGANSVTLTSQQLPSHIHANTLTFTNSDHTHFTVGGNSSNSLITAATSIAIDAALGGNTSYALAQGGVPATLGLTSPSKSALTIDLTNVAAGGNLPHANNQPAIAAYYIMYRP